MPEFNWAADGQGMKGIRWALGVLVVLLLLLHTAPYILRDQVVLWLQRQGAEDVGLRALKLQWWRGRVELDGLHAEAPGRLPLNLDRLVLDLELPALFERRLLVSELRLSDLESGFRLRDGAFWLGPVNLSALAAKQSPTPPAPDVGEPSSWRLGLDLVRFEQVDWRTELPDQQHHLELALGELDELYQWRENEQSRLRLEGLLNGAAFDIDTQAIPLPEQKSTQMRLSLQDFPVESVTAPWIPGLSARMTFDLELDATLGGSDARLLPRGRLRLEDLSYRSDELILENRQLAWEGEIEVALENLLPEHLNMKARLELQQPSLQQPTGIKAALESLSWNGELGLAFASAAPGNLQFEGDLRLAGTRVDVPAVVNGTLSALGWRGRAEFGLSEGLPDGLDVRGSLDLGEVRLQLPETGAVGLQKGRWEGSLGLAFDDGEPRTLTLNGDLALDNQQLTLAAQALDMGLKTLAWNGSLQQNLASGQGQTEVDGRLKASGVAVGSPQFSAALGEFGWQGSSRLQQQALALDGEVEAAALTFSQPQKLEAGVGAVSSSLQISSQDLAAFAVQLPAFAARDAEVAAGPDAYPLLRLDSLELEALSLDTSGNLELRVARLGGLKAARAGEAPLADVGQIRLSQLKYDGGRRATLSQLMVRDSSSRIRLDSEGRPADILALQAALVAMGPSETSADSEEAGAGEPAPVPAWLLEQLSLGGSNRVLFEDASTDPVFTADIDIGRFNIEQLGTLNQAPSPFELSATVNRFAELEAEGALNLFGGLGDGNWQASLEGVELPAVSPYSIRYTGYYLQSGQLHLESEGTLKAEVLEGSNHIRLNRVEVDRVDPEQSAELSAQLSMPLETALAVLQDDDRNIELDVPISGSLDDPDFGYQSVINIIAEKGLKSAAMGYLSNALQPYGALITLAGMAVDASKSGSFIELAPVEFAPGRADLDPAQHDYLNKIAAMLNERKGLRLNLCGQAVQQDRAVLLPLLNEEQSQAEEPLDEAGLEPELKRRLQNLADGRAATVKDYLDDRVDSERLFLCYSQLALDDADARPVVHLGL